VPSSVLSLASSAPGAAAKTRDIDFGRPAGIDHGDFTA